MENYDLKHEDGNWKLQRQGTERAAIVFDGKTKEQALQQSVEFMKQHHGSLKIHKEDGTYQEERTYPRSADPTRSPG
jgi:hypothetical protein